MAPYKRFAPSYRLARPAAAAPASRSPLTGAIIDAVLRHADLHEDLGCGRTLMRISPKRLGDRQVREALGSELDRAKGVSIIWNEREGEILRVLDAPAGVRAA
jgi:hypothetical protein